MADEPLTLLPTAEVAARLDIDRSTVQRLVQRGELAPAVKGAGLRGPMYFTEAEVTRYLNASPNPAPAPPTH